MIAPELRFLGWEAPLLPLAASHLVGEAARDGVADLGSTLLVLPGSRAGRRLLELVVEAASREGLHLIPPARVLTLGALSEELYRPSLPIASPAEGRRAWGRALGEAPEERLRDLFGAVVEGKGGGREALIPLARLLDSLSALVGGAGLDFRDVATACRQGPFPGDEGRWSALADVQDAARALLRTAGRIDRESARRAALRDPDRDARTVVLVGVVEMPLAAREILRRRAGRILALVHAPEEARDGFDEMGLLRGDWWLEKRPPLEDGGLSVQDRPSDQAREAVRFLRDLDGAFPPEAITLGLTDRSLLPSLVQELRDHGVPHRYAEGTPVESSPPALLLSALSRYLAGHRFASLAALLRHPDLPEDLEPGRAPELADAYFQDHLPAGLSPGPLPVQHGDRALATILEALRTELMGHLQGGKLLREWAPLLLELLGRAYGERRFHPDRPGDRVMVEASLRLRAGAEALGTLPPALDEELGAAEAIAALLSEVEEERIPPPAEEGAIELVGWLELHLDDAPVLAILGVNEPDLPESISAHPFLPDGLRTRLGLPDNRARLARDIYLLTAVLRSRERVLLVSGRRSEDGDPLRPSRLLLRGDAEEVARRILRFTGGEDQDRAAQGPAGSSGEGRVTPHSGFRLPPHFRLPLPSLPRPLPITAFRGLMDDPYAWFLERILRLEEVGDGHHEMDALGFGNLAHKVLDRFARTPEASSSDPEAIGRRLDRLLAGAAREQFGPSPLPSVPVQVEQLRSRLRAYAEWQAGWVAAGWRIHATEARTPPEGVPFPVDGEPVFLSGRVDRIDRHVENGAWMILDYKTGEGDVEADDARSRDGRWRDLQLPLYRFVVGHLLRGDGSRLEPPPLETPVGVAYLSLSGSDRPVHASEGSWTEAEMREAWEAARELIRVLRREGAVVFGGAPRESGGGGGLTALLGGGILQEIRT